MTDSSVTHISTRNREYKRVKNACQSIGRSRSNGRFSRPSGIRSVPIPQVRPDRVTVGPRGNRCLTLLLWACAFVDFTCHADEPFRRGASLASRQAALENEGVRASVDRYGRLPGIRLAVAVGQMVPIGHQMATGR